MPVLEDKDKSTLKLTNEVMTVKREEKIYESVCDSILHEFSNLFGTSQIISETILKKRTD